MPTIWYVLPQRGPLFEAPVPDRQRASDSRRKLECPREIIEVLFGRSTIGGFPQPRFLELIQRFVGHLWVSAALYGDPLRRKPDFERLTDVDEVWMMCFRQPKISQWRMMGRFTQQDHFIGLELYDRYFLDGKRKYHAIAAGFPTRWNAFMGNIPVMRRTSVRDYISSPNRDVYEPIT